MSPFEITTAAETSYLVSPIQDKGTAFEIRKGKESCLLFKASKGTWSTGDFAPPFIDFDVDEIGKLIEFELKKH